MARLGRNSKSGGAIENWAPRFQPQADDKCGIVWATATRSRVFRPTKATTSENWPAVDHARLKHSHDCAGDVVGIAVRLRHLHFGVPQRLATMKILSLALATLSVSICRLSLAQVPLLPETRGLPTGPEIGKLAAASAEAALGALKAAKSADDTVRAWESAANFARDSASGVFQAWNLTSTFPDAANALRKANDPAQLTLDKALLSRDQQKLDPILKALKDSVQREQVRRDARYLVSRLDEILIQFGQSPTIVLFAEGDVRGVATGDSTKGGTGSGQLGATLVVTQGVFQVGIAVASTVDTVRAGWGNSVLAPGTGQSLRSGTASFFWKTVPWNVPKLRFYGSVSTYHWNAIDKSVPATADTITADASTFGLGALVRGEPGCCRVLDNPVTLAFEAGVALRNVNGNVAGKPSFRKLVLGTTRRTFVGPELGMQLAFGKVTGSLAAYYLVPKRDEHVDGLTDFQIVAAFTASSEIFRGPLTR